MKGQNIIVILSWIYFCVMICSIVIFPEMIIQTVRKWVGVLVKEETEEFRDQLDGICLDHMCLFHVNFRSVCFLLHVKSFFWFGLFGLFVLIIVNEMCICYRTRCYTRQNHNNLDTKTKTT